MIGVPEAKDQCPPWILHIEEAGLHIEVPGALRAVRVDAAQAGHIGGEGQFSELLRLIDDDLVDSDFGDRQQIVLARGQRFETFLMTLLHPLDALAREAVLAVDLAEELFIGLQLVLDHLRLKGGRDGNELEGAVGDDDRVPARRGGAAEEAMALLLHEIGFVRDEDAGVRIQGEKFPRRLRQAVAGHDEHRLVDEAEPALLHDRGRDRQRLAGADGVGDVGASGSDDPPDRPLLVPI